MLPSQVTKVTRARPITVRAMHVRPISDSELPAFIETSKSEYAEQKHSMGGVPIEQARARAAQETEQLFPGGRLAPGHAILVGVDEAGEVIGRLWMAPHPGSDGVAFIYDIQVEPAFRGNGHGRELMNVAKSWSIENGYRTVKLHVFGRNDVAINLYRSLGYVTTDLMMELTL